MSEPDEDRVMQCLAGGHHEYQTQDGQELVCRVCRHVYEPPVRPVVYDPKPVERLVCLCSNLIHAEGDDFATCNICARRWPLPSLTASERSIEQHEGKKYLRSMRSAVDPNVVIQVDIYNVLVAFNVTCPAIAHCIKKLLAPGQRGKGSVLSDLQGALAALRRAIELQQEREGGQ